MKNFLMIKNLAYKNQIDILWNKKEIKEDITSFSFHLTKKRGLISKLRELVTYNVLDKMLKYDYKYEYSYFNELEAFKTPNGYIKYISKTIDTRFDFVFNDLEAKHYNGFKTFITINTKVYKFIRSFEKMKPLQKISLFTKRLEGLYPKQKEFYNLTGGNKNYHTMEIMTDITDNTSTFSNIFTCFTYLKKHVISLLSNINNLLFKTLFDNIFVNLSYKRNKYTVFLNGFTALLRKRLFRIKHYIPYKIFKTMKTSEKTKRSKKLRRKLSTLNKIFFKNHVHAN